MDPISANTPIALGFVFTVVTLLVGGMVRIDRRFNHLETQMREQQRGRLTRQQHEVWALRMEIANQKIGLKVPRMAGDEPEAEEASA